jgi:hypothetical protein
VAGSDVLPKLAKGIGASVEQLLGISPIGDRRPEDDVGRVA